MSKATVRVIRISLVHLALGATLGALLPMFSRLLNPEYTHVHMNLLGFVSLMFSWSCLAHLARGSREGSSTVGAWSRHRSGWPASAFWARSPGWRRGLVASASAQDFSRLLLGRRRSLQLPVCGQPMAYVSQVLARRVAIERDQWVGRHVADFGVRRVGWRKAPRRVR